jgi:hypothetical protein
MKKLKILLIIVSGTFVVSCQTNTYNEISKVNLEPSYVTDIQPIVKSNCTGCHSSGNQYPSLETYAEVKDAIVNGTFICRIDEPCGNIMPPSGKMQQSTIDLIKLWVTKGYAN